MLNQTFELSLNGLGGTAYVSYSLFVMSVSLYTALFILESYHTEKN